MPNSGVFVLPITTTGRAQPAGKLRVLGRDVVGEGLGGERRADPGRLDQVLDRQRDTAEQAGRRRLGVAERLVGHDRDVCVQLTVQLLDPIEVELHELDGRNLAVPDEPRLLERGEEGERHAVQPFTRGTRPSRTV